MNSIVMIDIRQLYHHPENPRMDLGDLTELAESIRKNGVMQNLTVIPGHRMTKDEWVKEARAEGADKVSAEASYRAEDAWTAEGYTVVIGNRRMEAAKIAGLTELPCMISDMDHKAQISTMLMENMQRTDLTVYEQAQGFQMMMDLGFSEKEIGEKTGFSEKTVRDRIRMTKLEPKRFEKAVSKGATLMDLIEISKIDSKGDQNALMEAAGTNNFRMMMNRAKEEQAKRETEKRVTPILKEYAKAMPDGVNLWGANPDYSKVEEIKDGSIASEKIRAKLKKAKKDHPEEELFFRYFKKWDELYPGIEIYVKNEKAAKTMTEEEKTERQRQIARAKQVKKVKEYWAEAYKLRRDFIRNYTIAVNGTSLGNMAKLIVRYALEQRPTWGTTYNHQWDKNVIMDLLGLKQEEYEDKGITIADMIEGRTDIPPLRALAAWVCGGGVFWPDDPEHGEYDTYKGGYCDGSGKDNGLRKLYGFLEEIGYEMSDMEKQLMDGTHEVYKGAEEL